MVICLCISSNLKLHSILIQLTIEPRCGILSPQQGLVWRISGNDWFTAQEVISCPRVQLSIWQENRKENKKKKVIYCPEKRDYWGLPCILLQTKRLFVKWDKTGLNSPTMTVVKLWEGSKEHFPRPSSGRPPSEKSARFWKNNSLPDQRPVHWRVWFCQ